MTDDPIRLALAQWEAWQRFVLHSSALIVSAPWCFYPFSYL